ncbi:MAG: hydantoinase B/oxoprolinase family protein, partial [Myxococcales bacterium]|nr:hydantoinase B/oxoprolinase family protein [Myxococcales bacterium]
MADDTPGWRFFIDRGGTFTDCVARDPAGRLRVAKLLSSDDAPLAAIRQLLGLPDGAPLPGGLTVRMGTTVATNALLERAGARVGLVITRGFGDLLEIGDQARPQLFALAIEKPAPLCEEVLEVDARVSPAGELLARPDPRALQHDFRAMFARGVRSLAIAVLHAYTPAGKALERELAALARTCGFGHVTLSHEVSGGLGLLARAETAVTDAYLTPPLRARVGRLAAALPGSRLHFMQSSGDLCDASRFRGRDAIVSGPAGGVVAVAELARRLGLGQVIGFDMGGTSTDVCRHAGEFERSYETRVAGVRVRTPMLALHTVAAGGGSICAYDGRRFSVGPQSVGADPGPLCYGRPGAGPLALTDISLALGRILPHRFPFPLARARVDAALERLSEKTGLSAPAVAQGFFAVAASSMAAAIRAVSVARGHDVREHAMIVFGGAGGQFACAVARELGVRTLVFHPLAGVLSAKGIGVARLGWHGEADAGRRVLEPGALRELTPTFEALVARGRAALEDDGAAPDAIRVTRRVDLRYRGTQTPLTIALPEPLPDDEDERDALEELRARFVAAHRRAFGYARPEHPVELVRARVELGAAGEPDASRGELATQARPGEDRGSLPEHVTLWADGRRHERVPVRLRETLFTAPGETALEGPALILEATATIVLDPGWRMEQAAGGCLIARDDRPVLGDTEEERGGAAPTAGDAAPDPVRLEIMGNRFMAIAEEMGVALQNTAQSVNIKERLDFSCALFNAAGELVANAPHVPVHLGSMDRSVETIIRRNADTVRPGDVFALNAPYDGGTHLPD